MKKAVSFLCVLAVTLIVSLGGIVFASAGTLEEECDLVFRKALEEILEEEGVDAPVIEVTKEPLYDIQLEQFGYVYNMEYDGGKGFALIINTDYSFGVAEFYMEGTSPYVGYDGLSVYVKSFTYLVYQEDCFIETQSGMALDEETVERLAEKALYAAPASFTTGGETINFTNKTEDKKELTKRHPAYISAGSLASACVPSAGGNVIGYYTRYYPGLMPGYTPGYTALGIYLYYETANEGTALITTLYYAMGTNAAGTTIDQFKTGMNNYVTGKGRSISYSSCMSGGSFNYNTAKTKIEAGLPLVLFVDRFRIDSFQEGTTSVGINYTISDGCHAMAGFGYNKVTYNLTSGGTRTDTYIQVATGLINQSKGYYNIYYNTTVDECYAIAIS